MNDEVKYSTGETYLIVKGVKNRFGPRGNYSLQSFHTRKTKPDVASDEVAIKLSLKLPAALFEKPMLSAAIDIDGDVPVMELTPETINSIEDVIRSTSGLDVRLAVVPPE